MVKVEPTLIVHADGKERRQTEYSLYVHALTEHRFKSKKQAEQAALVIEKAIRKVIA
jgi:cation transport regulator ChaC